MATRHTMTAAFLVLLAPTVGPSAPDQVRIGEARSTPDGVLVHHVVSPYQSDGTRIRVLLPRQLEKDKRYPVVYVLPVEAGDECRYGDGLVEVQRLDHHNKHRAIFVAPSFSHLPWYADHPTRPEVRQESHVLEVIVPFIDRQYPAQANAEGRLLLGFSKSGWGAFSLLLRHPATFGKAAAWDAPLMKDKPDLFVMEGIFETQKNFDNYRISTLLKQRATELRGSGRLILTGYGNFRQHHQQAHDLMERLGIVHTYRDGPQRKHDWHSGWVDEAVRLLLD